MSILPFSYNEPLFRPPAEANSAIIQATIGCSWNRCAFCEMYTTKKFSVRNIEDLKPEIDALSRSYNGIKKIFLADGNAFVLSANKLVPILIEINKSFGKLQRISSYALPKDICSKSMSELKELNRLGLKLLYIGIETGDDELLKIINKGETFDSTINGIQMAHDAGIETSIMIINGLGGKKYSHQHALNSAKIINKIDPKYLSTLTLSLPFGLEHFKNKFNGDFEPMTIVDLFKELRVFLSDLELNNVIYRSNHISNNLMLQGILSKDKDNLINSIDRAISLTPKNLYPSSPMNL